VFERIDVAIIYMSLVIAFVPDSVFPIAALPDATFALGEAAWAVKFTIAMGRAKRLRYFV